MLNIALKFGYIDGKQFQFLENLSIETSKILSGFIKTL